MDIIPAKKKNVIMDATTLSTVMSCGRFYDIRHNHRLVSSRGKSNSLEIGQLIHKVFEVFYKHKIRGFPRETCIGQAMSAGQMFVTGCSGCAYGAILGPNGKPTCGHDPEEYPGMQNSPEFSEGYKTGWKFALETCQGYFESNTVKNDSFIPLAVEEVRGEVVYEDDEIRILWKAKFDLIIDTSEIGIVSMDHKSFKQSRNKSTLSNQFLGHCVLLKSRNVIVNKIGLQSSYKLADRLSREYVSFSGARIIEWQSEILPYYAYKFIDYAESGYWPPDYTHCDTMFGPCPYKPVCEGDPNMREQILQNDYVLAPVWDPTANKDAEE